MTPPIQLLVVEDNPIDREVVRRAVGSEARLVEAATLAEAVEHLGAGSFDCALLDLGLPDSLGIETVERLLAVAPDLPILVLTGLRDRELGARAIALGAQDYLPKGDVTPLILNRSIRHAIERHKTLRALRTAQDQLLQRHRLEAIGQLAGGIAHDFNNILAVITLFTASARDSLRDPDPANDDLAEVLKATKHAQGLVQQLLAFARQQPGSPEPVDVGALVGSMLRILGRTLGRMITLEVALDDDCVVHMDQSQLEQIILNLAINARDAMPDGGTLTIRVRSTPASGDPGDGQEIAIQITDTGQGMDAESLARAVEPFYTTKDHGSGLGLATCFGIIDQAGGRIDLSSVLGEGTTVEIRLPRYAAQPAIPKGEAPPSPLEDCSECILVVEDSVPLRRVLTRLLSSSGYTVLQSSDGVEALEILGRDATISLVLTDMAMPRMGGIELTRRVGEMFPQTPVVLMSGNMGPDPAGGSVHARASIRKPFHPPELLHTLRSVLDA